MYNFHYDTVKYYGRENVCLMYTDTDSFIYSIKCDDLYQDMYNRRDKYDLSDVNDKIIITNENGEMEKLRRDENKKVVGKMKEENEGVVITEFIGIKSKMYSYKKNNIGTCKTLKVKGCQSALTQTEVITHDNYYNTLFGEKQTQSFTVTGIRSKKHNIQTYKLEKQIFTPYNDKVFILDDGINCLPYGHKSTR